MSVADTSPPRRVLVVATVLVAAVTAGQALLPLGPLARLGLALAAAYVVSIGGGVRWGLLTQILPETSFRLARSAMNIAVGAFQVVGFARQRLLLQVLSVRGVFALAAVLATLAVPVLLLGLSEQPVRRTAAWAARDLAGEPAAARRAAHPAAAAGAVRPERARRGLRGAVRAYARTRRACCSWPARSACSPATCWSGGCSQPRQRRRASLPLRVLLAAAFVPFVLPLPLALAALLDAIGAAGYGASLLQQEQLVALAPEDVRGQALGVEGSARMTCQGLCAGLAGALADVVGAGTAITLLALSSLAVTAVLAPALARAEAAARH
jgi:hypothetical protein